MDPLTYKLLNPEDYRSTVGGVAAARS